MKAGTRVAATIHGRLPGRLEEIRYYRTSDHPGYYKHAFATPTDIFALTDGGLLIRPRHPGGPMGTPKLWLDNPRRGRKHHGRRRGYRRNPYLAAYNPPAMALLRSYASMPYAMAAASGGAGFAATYLGYKALFSFTALSTYGADPGWAGILVRTGGRVVAAALGDFALVRFLAGHHNRLAYIGGAAAYVGLAGLLEALGYQVTVGAPAGAPLVSLLPTSLVPATAIAGVDGGLEAFIRNRVRQPRGIAGTGAFISSQRALGVGGTGLHPSRMYANRLSP